MNILISKKWQWLFVEQHENRQMSAVTEIINMLNCRKAEAASSCVSALHFHCKN